MTGAELLSQLRFLTNQNSTTLVDADGTRLHNIYFKKLVQAIVDTNEDFFGEYSTFNLVANQREYLLPTDILKIKRLEVTYDGTNWYTGVPMIEHSIGTAIDDSNATVVDANYSQSGFQYHVYDASVFLYPKPTSAVTAGGKLYYIKRQSDLAADSVESVITIPKEFHSLISLGASADVFRRLGKEDRARVADANFARGVQEMKAQIAGRNLDDDLQLRPLGQDYN